MLKILTFIVRNLMLYYYLKFLLIKSLVTDFCSLITAHKLSN